MKITITENYDEMSKEASKIVIDLLQSKPNCVLGLATGSTPIGMYNLLANACQEGKVSFKDVRTVNLDEYVGLGETSDQSYVYFMNKNLFDKVDIDKRNTHLPNGRATNLEKECEEYTKLVSSMPQDLQVLGLGSNGHIGFNEPNTSFNSTTHVVSLTENTIKDNSRLFNSISEVPTQALSMGIKDIMQSKKILMLVSGKNKAQAVYSMIKGEVSESCPASVLQLHNDVVVVLDKDASSLL